jgi:hypothetical protein
MLLGFSFRVNLGFHSLCGANAFVVFSVPVPSSRRCGIAVANVLLASMASDAVATENIFPDKRRRSSLPDFFFNMFLAVFRLSFD